MSRLALDPILIEVGAPRRLHRLRRVHEEFDEAFLQELLVQHPALLPVQSLREDVGDLLCIGREVVAGESGSIDNLYLSAGGYPVLVETKLWRNPESRREVLAQVLDYTKDLVGKDFAWFERQWAAFAAERKLGSDSLVDRLSSMADDEIDWSIIFVGSRRISAIHWLFLSWRATKSLVLAHQTKYLSSHG